MADLYQDLKTQLDERKHADWYSGEYGERSRVWQDWKSRCRKVDAIYRGDWSVVFPDDRTITEYPKITNMVQVAAEDHADLASSVIPSIRCDRLRESAKEYYEKKERIAANYRLSSNYDGMRPYLFMDMEIWGANFKLVLPNFKTGFPEIRILDPAHCYPNRLFTPDRGLQDLICYYEEPICLIAEEYPNAGITYEARNKNELVGVIEYYDASEFVKVAEIKGQSGNQKHAVELLRVPNRIGRVPVSVAKRPTRDRQFRGLYDQVLGVLQAENMYTNLVIDSMVDWITAPPVEFDIENPEDYGKAILHARSAQGFMRRFPPDSNNPQMYAQFDTMRKQVRESTRQPEARAGNIEQSIASAAFVSSIQGGVSTLIAGLQRVEAASESEVLSICFAVDQAYLDSRKEILGKGIRAPETYLPSKDINGDYNVRVLYGSSEGTTKFDQIIRTVQLRGNGVNGMISDETALEQLDVVDDIQRERNRILKQRALAGVLAILDAQSAAGNPYPWIEASKFINEGQDVMLHLEQIAQLVVPLPQGGATGPQGAPGGALGQGGALGTEAFTEASSVARGGSPTTNVPGVGSLPPLSDLLVG